MFARLPSLAAATVLLSLGLISPASAEEVAGDNTTREVAAVGERVVPLPELSLAELLPDSKLFHRDVMAQIDINLRPVQGLVDELTRAYVDRDDAEDRRLVGNQERATLLRQRWEHRVLLAERVDAEVAADAAAVEAFSNLGLYGVSTFVGNVDLDLEKFQVDGITSPVPELTDSAESVLTQQLASSRAELAARRLALADAERTAVEIDEGIEAAEERIAIAEDDRAEAEGRVADLAPRFERALVAQKVDGTDIPIIVVDAYFQAQVITAERRPGCRVTWDQLAGIGLIETRHGSFGGSEVGPDGTTTNRILGPVLDGTQFAAISDTDGGRLDGNTVWDRAVGPMQFIPGSWKIYGQDGNGDDVNDPHNMYDAALSAAEHLCRSRNGLDADENFRIALLGYNRSEQYGIDVMAARANYRQAVRLVSTPEPPSEETDPA